MFKAGDRVVCVKAGVGIGLVKDEIYTITECFDDTTGGKAVNLSETSPPQPYEGYLTWRFKKAKDEFVDNLLAEVTKKAKEELEILI